MIYYRIEKDLNNINPFHGEAGYGIYATPDQRVLEYYKRNSNQYRILKLSPNNANIIDLTKKVKELIPFIKRELIEIANRNSGYIMPKINASTYHRFPWAITKFIQNFDCDAYLIQHKGPNLPTGKQLVILNLEKFSTNS